MARKKKKGGEEGLAAWLVTFSDLVTLLLTFFVLLLSMASMDRVMLSRMTPFSSDVNVVNYRGSGQIPQSIKLVLKLIENPQSVLDKPNRLKDLLFPEDELPPDIDVSTLDRNLRIMLKPEGLAIVLTDDLLFPSGGYTLNEGASKLLEQVGLMLRYTSADCNITGHTDNIPGRRISNDDLSGLRAMAVLDYYLKQDFTASRFSISAYGADKPLESNDTEAGRRMNRRVEILVKTEQWLGRYL